MQRAHDSAAKARIRMGTRYTGFHMGEGVEKGEGKHDDVGKSNTKQKKEQKKVQNLQTKSSWLQAPNLHQF